MSNPNKGNGYWRQWFSDPRYHHEERRIYPLAAATLFSNASCASRAERTEALPVMKNPETFFGKRIEICGDLERGVDTGVEEMHHGYVLFLPSDVQSLWGHGRRGIFLPSKTWIAKFVGKQICVEGSISHRSGMTPQQVSEQPLEVTSVVLDTQWRLDATNITFLRKAGT